MFHVLQRISINGRPLFSVGSLVDQNESERAQAMMRIAKLSEKPRAVFQSSSLREKITRKSQYHHYCPVETWAPAINLYEDNEQYILCPTDLIFDVVHNH